MSVTRGIEHWQGEQFVRLLMKWSSVLPFVAQMLVKLEHNEHKGQDGDWVAYSVEDLWHRVMQESAEAYKVLAQRQSLDDATINDELADIGNMLMMVADSNAEESVEQGGPNPRAALKEHLKSEFAAILQCGKELIQARKRISELEERVKALSTTGPLTPVTLEVRLKALELEVARLKGG